MIELKNITLICVDGRMSPKENLDSFKSLLYSSKDINFGEIKLISCINHPISNDKNIEFIKIPPMSISEYNNFIIKKLYDYVDTEYVIIVQNDGFILNYHLWVDDFLNYDYIGSPWINHEHYNRIRVGNGGFSLRSKKFLEIGKNKCPFSGFNEDHLVCITYRNIFLENGIKYAPVEVAMKFALEKEIDECEFDLNKTFGFHGDKILSSNLLNNVNI